MCTGIMIVYGSVANAVVEYYRVVRAAVPLYIQKLKPTNECSVDYLLSAREAIPLRMYCGARRNCSIYLVCIALNLQAPIFTQAGLFHVPLSLYYCYCISLCCSQ